MSSNRDLSPREQRLRDNGVFTDLQMSETLAALVAERRQRECLEHFTEGIAQWRSTPPAAACRLGANPDAVLTAIECTEVEDFLLTHAPPPIEVANSIPEIAAAAFEAIQYEHKLHADLRYALRRARSRLPVSEMSVQTAAPLSPSAARGAPPALEIPVSAGQVQDISAKADPPIPDYALKAGQQYQAGAAALDGEPTDREVYDRCMEMLANSGESGELPDFGTWGRYVRKFRNRTDTQKNKPRGGRSAASIVRKSEI